MTRAGIVADERSCAREQRDQIVRRRSGQHSELVA
jgi:hypothetical protein